MNRGRAMSAWEMFLEGTLTFWSPVLEVAKLQSRMNARTLEETVAAAERSGCMVAYADLPDNVSGFAETIEGQRYIVLNRAKPRIDLEYTLPHELGHHVLKDSVEGLEELGAHLFAAAWIAWPGNKRRVEILRENAEASATMLTCLVGTLLLALVALIIHITSKFIPTHRPLPPAK